MLANLVCCGLMGCAIVVLARRALPLAMVLRRYHPAPAIAVWHRDGAPAAFRWRGRLRHIDAIDATTEEVWGWWSADAVSRRCHRVRCHDGLVCTIFRDKLTGVWHLESVED